MRVRELLSGPNQSDLKEGELATVKVQTPKIVTEHAEENHRTNVDPNIKESKRAVEVERVEHSRARVRLLNKVENGRGKRRTAEHEILIKSHTTPRGRR